MFYIYVTAYFVTLVIVLPILQIRRFGVGVAVFLPYAVLGAFVEYYMEWVLDPVLVSPWAVLGWCAFGLFTGLSADLTFRFIPVNISERLRAVTSGLVVGIVTFALTAVALACFYTEVQTGPGSFLGIAYYGVPFLLISSGFGGYTAHAISGGA